MKKSRAIILLAILSLQLTNMACAWEMERPHDGINIESSVEESAYTNGEASVGLGVVVKDYAESFYGDFDILNSNVSMTANSRKGFTYYWDYDPFKWIGEDELSYRTYYYAVADDWGAWISFPPGFMFRFYGGRWSGEYEKVWVTSNGFISFEESYTTRWTPTEIPSREHPDTLIAALWTDLKIDSQASIITGLYEFMQEQDFVIIWKNALHKWSGKRLTFEVILEEARGYFPVNERYRQSRIWISYSSVSAIIGPFAYGIEDHEGLEGIGFLRSGALLAELNQQTIVFFQSSNSFFLKRFTLEFYDSNSKSSFDIRDDEPELIRGYNVKIAEPESSQPDPTRMFHKALAGTAVRLLPYVGTYVIGGAVGGILVSTAGVAGWALVTLAWYEWLAYLQYSHITKEVYDWPAAQYAYIKVPTEDYVVDATVGVCVYWILKDPNNEPHSLTITAKLEYYEYSIDDGSIIDKPPVTTSVTLNVKNDDNDTPSLAESIGAGICYSWLYLHHENDDVDFYRIELAESQRIYIKMAPFTGGDFDLYLYHGGEEKGKSEHRGDVTETMNLVADSEGVWHIKVTGVAGDGFYTLEVSLGGVPLIPSKPSGPTEGHINQNLSYSTSTIDPDGSNQFIQYEFDWGDGTTTLTVPKLSGHEATAWHSWSLRGEYKVKVRAEDSSGLWTDWSEALLVNMEAGGMGGGGCPHVFTWDGTRYMFDNNVLPAAEYSNGSDVTDYYLLQRALVYDSGKYSMLISELEREDSYLDMVRLLAVDHDADVNVGVSPTGEVLTYTDPHPPISAISKSGENVLELLETMDDTYYQAHQDDYIILDFGNLDTQDGAKLVVRSDFPVRFKSPVYFQVLDSTGNWNTVATIYTRLCWSIDIINLSECLPNKDGEIKVRLYFVSNDKIDYVGLDTSPQAEIEIHQANLASAIHSEVGDVKEMLVQDDNTYAGILPGEQITLKFTLPPNKEDERDFIIIVEGHYFTITP